MLAERFRSVSLSKYPPFITVCAAPVRKIPDVSLWRELRVKTHIALFTKNVRPRAGNSQCPEKMASRMKPATAPGQNTDFRKSEKSSISTGCTKNESSVTSGINFSVAVFVRHSIYLHNNDIINAVHGGSDGPPSFCLLFLPPVCLYLICTAQRFQPLTVLHWRFPPDCRRSLHDIR